MAMLQQFLQALACNTQVGHGRGLRFLDESKLHHNALPHGQPAFSPLGRRIQLRVLG